MKKYIVLIILLLLQLNINAQELFDFSKTIPELTTPNSEAYGLGRYGDVPMNLYTGTANISIPLYNLDFDGLDIPLNLSYNTGGIRTSQEATWVGLGWTLSVEPIITRQIKGQCDITKGYSTQNLIGFVYTDVPLPSYGGYLDNELQDKLKTYFSPHSSVSGWDTEQDIFTINIWGESASFVLTQKALNEGVIGVEMINGDKQYRVEYIEGDKSFIVTNGRGYKFYFNEKEYSLTATYNGSGYNVPAVHAGKLITSWRLTKATSPKNGELVFNYKRTATQGIPQHSGSLKKSCTPGNNVPGSTAGGSNTQSSHIVGHEVLYLESIQTRHTSIEFNGTSRLDVTKLGVMEFEATNINLSGDGIPIKLDNITVKSSLGEIIHNYDFEYSYFNEDQIVDSGNEALNRYIKAKIRLKLDNIRHNNTLYRSFSYINPNQLPHKKGRYDDFWGFYNGDHHTTISYPSYIMDSPCGITTQKINFQGANRKSNFDYAKNGLLEKIYYPTGGYTKIDYESHDIKIDDSNILNFKNFDWLQYEEIIIESQSVDYPKESEIFEITEDINLESLFEVYFGPGGQYDITQEYSHRKYSIEEKDRLNIAFQLINIDSGDIIIDGRFTQGLDKTGSALKPTESNDWNKQRVIKKLPKGRYKAIAKALKHISNFYDEKDGAVNYHPDYGKQYNFWVKVIMKIPQLSFQKSFNSNIGGARVKSIENYENNSLLDRKEYKYTLDNESNESSGVLIDKLVFHNTKSHTFVWYHGANHDETPIVYTDNIIEIFSDNILHSPSSTHIGYSRVEEIFTNNQGENKNIGKKVSEFINKPNEYDVNLGGNSGNVMMTGIPLVDYFINIITPPIGNDKGLVYSKSFHDINGKLMKEEYYDNTGNKIKESICRYNHASFDSPNLAHSNGISTSITQYLKPFYTNRGQSSLYSKGSEFYALQVYRIISENISLISKTDIDYLNNIPVSKTTTYEYNSQFLPSKIKITTSVEDKESETEYRYPTDLIGIEQKNLIRRMVEENIITDPIIIKAKKGLIQTAESHTKYKEIPIIYQEDNQTKSKNLIVLDEVHQLVGKGNINVEAGNNDNRKIKYDSYDKQGNLIQYTFEGKMPICILWSYSGQYPIAEIQNATYDQVKAHIDIDALSQKTKPTENDIRSIQNLQTTLKDAMITTYTYKPLVGMTTMTDPSGVTTYYEYDDFGRLKESYYYENNDVNKRRVLQTYEYNYQNQ